MSFKSFDGVAIKWLLLGLILWMVVVLLTVDMSVPHKAPVPLSHPAPPTKEEENLEIVQQLPNLPMIFYHETEGKHYRMFYKNQSCALFPSIYKILYKNNYWHTLHTEKHELYLYSAYYDVRKLSTIGPSVRILAMVNGGDLKLTTYCQFWFESEDSPVIVKYNDYKHIWNDEWEGYADRVLHPYLVTCRIPEDKKDKIPAAVSLVETECSKATNLLHVAYEAHDERKNFVVCISGLEFLFDISPRLIEWMELLQIMGVEMVFFYNFDTHPNITKIIQYYVDQGKAEEKLLSLPGGQPNHPLLRYYYLLTKPELKRLINIIIYNDCLYKNMYSYKYIIPLNIDEMIVPLEDNTWTSFIDKFTTILKNKDLYASYKIRQIYYLDEMQNEHGLQEDIPEFLHILQHVYRSKNPSLNYFKAFHDTDKIITLEEQLPVHVFDGILKTFPLSASQIILNSYRENCMEELHENCDVIKKYPVEDNTIWKYKYDLTNRTLSVLEELGFFNDVTI